MSTVSEVLQQNKLSKIKEIEEADHPDDVRKALIAAQVCIYEICDHLLASDHITLNGIQPVVDQQLQISKSFHRES